MGKDPIRPGKRLFRAAHVGSPVSWRTDRHGLGGAEYYRSPVGRSAGREVPQDAAHHALAGPDRVVDDRGQAETARRGRGLRRGLRGRPAGARHRRYGRLLRQGLGGARGRLPTASRRPRRRLPRRGGRPCSPGRRRLRRRGGRGRGRRPPAAPPLRPRRGQVPEYPVVGLRCPFAVVPVRHGPMVPYMRRTRRRRVRWLTGLPFSGQIAPEECTFSGWEV